MPRRKYLYQAKAVAAHFQYSDGDGNFVPPEFETHYSGFKDHSHRSDPKGTVARIPKRSKGKPLEIAFSRYRVHLHAYRTGRLYRTEVTAWVTDLNVKDVLKASRVEAGLISQYDERWFDDPGRPKRPRILPKPPVFQDLTIGGYSYGKDLRLPAPFAFSEAERSEYLSGSGPEIDPAGISSDPAYPGQINTPGGRRIEVSADTRRIRVEDFGIVYFADWTWLGFKDTCCQTTQWVELLRFELKNPGGGGVGGAGGGGSPS